MYAANGLSFFKMYEEDSDVSGNFKVKTVAPLDEEKGANVELHQMSKL